ncbi:MAG: hypothetical protein JOZ38_01555 [Candidatus Eremiobacteraeota bacterium]|nr:hypothetical protein [Candidatus Eremiobacteraeota bacterium]
MRSFGVLCAAFVLGVASACNGSGSTSMPATTQNACAGLAVPALLYPPSGATGVDDTSLQIWVGYPQNPNGTWSPPAVSAGAGGTALGGPYSPPSPGPTNPPGLASLPAGDSPFVSTLSGLPSSGTVSVNVTDGTCTQTIGSFTI